MQLPAQLSQSTSPQRLQPVIQPLSRRSTHPSHSAALQRSQKKKPPLAVQSSHMLKLQPLPLQVTNCKSLLAAHLSQASIKHPPQGYKLRPSVPVAHPPQKWLRHIMQGSTTEAPAHSPQNQSRQELHSRTFSEPVLQQ